MKEFLDGVGLRPIMLCRCSLSARYGKAWPQKGHKLLVRGGS